MSEEALHLMLAAIDQALASGATPIAAFDADGTLWDTDVGENFFKYQVEMNYLPKLPKDPWKHYLKMHNENVRDAFLWLAQVNDGIEISKVRGWAKEAIATGVPIFPWMQVLVEQLLARQVEVFVVTASVKWAVEPAAALLGIPEQNVLGIQTKVEKGIVTGVQGGPITYREGKADALLAAIDGKIPFLCGGNTMGDISLIELASHIRFANICCTPENPNYASELELLSIAKSKGWFFHQGMQVH